MRTVKEHLESLPHPLSLMAIRNADKSTLKLKKETLSQALSNAFCWSISPQGHKFWHGVVNRIEDLEGYMYSAGVNMMLHTSQTGTVPPYLFDYVRAIHEALDSLNQVAIHQAVKEGYYSKNEEEASVDYLQNHLSQFEEASYEL